MQYLISSLGRYVKKKGIFYFLYSASEEDKKSFEGILFDNGIPRMNFISALAEIST